MTNKCFITKHTGTVNNDDLPVLGELKITVLAGDTYGGIAIWYNKPGGAVSFSQPVTAMTVDASNENVTEMQYSDFKQASFLNVLNTENTIKVENKYLLNSIKNYATLDGTSYSSVLKFSINDLKYCTLLSLVQAPRASVSGDIVSLKDCTALTMLYLSNTSVSGDIVSLKDCTALTMLLLGNTSVSGDIASLKDCTALTTLYLGNTSVSGDITDIVTNCTKLTSLSIPSAVTITDEQKQTLTDRGCTVTIAG